MKRYIQSNEVLHPRTSNAEYADHLLDFMREYESDRDLLDFVISYIPSAVAIEALEDIADRLRIDISEVR